MNHPEYLDYVEQVSVGPHAKWHDIKALVKKITTAELRSIYVTPCKWSGDNGWLVELSTEAYIDHDMYIEQLKEGIEGVVRVGERVVWIGIKHG